MKFLIASDIHGSMYYLRLLLEKFKNYDYLILLGDILYHGARNPLPKEYNPKEVTKALNEIKDKIIAIKGNCDSEVDEMVLEFPLVKNSIIFYNSRKIFLTHGHEYNKDHLPNLSKNDIMLYGHFHIPFIIKQDGIIIANPSSISLPKENNKETYMTLENNMLRILDFNDNIIKKMDINLED